MEEYIRKNYPSFAVNSSTCKEIRDIDGLNAELDKDYNRALTLVHTETCYVQNQATINSYKDAELEEYEFLAFLDDRTTEECRKKDGIKNKLKLRDEICKYNPSANKSEVLK